MERPQGLLSLARLLPAAVRLAFRVLLQAWSFARFRRAAVRGFRRGLEEAGVPPEAAADLTGSYPDFDLKAAISRRPPEGGA